jgi:aspartate racemase
MLFINFRIIYNKKFWILTKENFLNAINSLVKNGAEGVILGCTEIPLVVQQKDAKVPLFDTARIHAESAVEYSLK